MIATSEMTALMAMKSAATIGMLNRAWAVESASGRPSLMVRPRTMKRITGIARLVTNPIGSLMNTLVSTQVSFQNLFSIASP